MKFLLDANNSRSFWESVRFIPSFKISFCSMKPDMRKTIYFRKLTLIIKLRIHGIKRDEIVLSLTFLQK